MKYLYYPGCSLEGTAREYDRSTRALLEALGVELTELADWTCCGASAAEAASRLLSLVLPARNLALAEAQGPGRDLLVPCSACYLNLKRVEEKVHAASELRQRINTVLAEDGLAYKGHTHTRHLLDILVRDIGSEAVAQRVVRPLKGLRVAPYYGCQCLRPYPVFDDPEAPRSMEPLIAAMGADVHPWTMGGTCCGASHMNTKMDVGLELVADLLSAAQGADAIVTVCPMCQMNLEAYQKKALQRAGSADSITVVYLPQILGVALGLDQDALGLGLNLALTKAFRQKLENAPAAV